MLLAAELGAYYARLQLLQRTEPHGDIRSRDGILLDSHRHDGVTVNHIGGGDLKDAGLSDGNLENRRDEVIPPVRVFGIDTRISRLFDQMPVNSAKLSILSGIVVAPGELVTDYPGPDRVLGLDVVKPVGALRPERKREAEQKNALKNGHSNLEVGRYVVSHAMIGGLGLSTPSESPASEQEERAPTHEEREHEPVHHFDHMVHTASVFGIVLRNAHGLDEGIRDQIHDKFAGREGWEEVLYRS